MCRLGRERGIAALGSANSSGRSSASLALFAAAPAFNGATIPVPLKVALAAVLALLVGSIVDQPAPLDLTWRSVILTGEQIVVGLAMGFAMQLALAAMAVAGDFVGVQMGFGFATLLGVEGNFAVPVMSDFFGLVGLVLFLAFNGHLIMVGALVKSFAVIPVAVGGVGARKWVAGAGQRRRHVVRDRRVHGAAGRRRDPHHASRRRHVVARRAADQPDVGGIFPVPLGGYRRDGHAGAVLRAGGRAHD